MSTEQAPPPDHWPVGRLLSAVARRIERAWDSHLASWELNHASMPVLVHVTAHPMSQRQLADACGVTEQTMSRVVARLERTGYVTRRPHDRDRRRHVIAITPAGTAALLACADPHPAQDAVLGHLPPERRALLEDLLREVIEPLNLLPEPARAPDDAGRPPTTRA
ncbi:MarR family winged helix-turn-helix transcriptional regulator [Cellulomonas sp. S1-8]|uniref:MarR family winged helix-turn-helix transcriptional regulator n=1 Tax=Cellulomonas sp. S1-8 TaxID=2904790 RepID=UPI002243D55C|nr:MarR family winged helix-turn-helix transcriptional regulator [Cellulomonas sp. S1-8]UZN01700.1 MarR family winged helix-turn-helix transcriptional regulator [Cellulomonas sp. S1-8]